MKHPERLVFFPNNQMTVASVDFSPDSTNVVYASGTDVDFYSLGSAQRTRSIIQAHNKPITSVKLARSYLVTASKDHYAKVWKTDVLKVGIFGDKCFTYRSHKGAIRSVDISSDEECICTASDEMAVHVWSPNGSKIAQLYGAHQSTIRCAKFHKNDSRFIASCGDDGRINIWDIRQKVISLKIEEKLDCVKFLDWSHESEYILASGSYDSCVRIWDIRCRSAKQIYRYPGKTVPSVDFHPNGNYLLSSSNSEWKILDLSHPDPVMLYTGKEGRFINQSKFAPDGQKFVNCGKGVQVWISNIPANDTTVKSEPISLSSASSLTPSTPASSSYCEHPCSLHQDLRNLFHKLISLVEQTLENRRRLTEMQESIKPIEENC